MLKLREIMSESVVAVSPDISIREAAELFAARHISGAPVVADGRLIGVVSASDILDFIATSPGVPSERPDQLEWGEMGDIVDWEEGSEPPAHYFTEAWDDAGASLSERFASVNTPEWNTLEEHSVAEVMTRSPLCVLGPDATVLAAAQLMEVAGVHRILVMDNENLVGVVSASDLAKALADNKLTTRTYVFGKAATGERSRRR